MLGVKFKDEISNNPFQRPIRYEDIVEVFPTIKHLHRIFFEEGTALSKVAVTKSSDELFNLAGITLLPYFWQKNSSAIQRIVIAQTQRLSIAEQLGFVVDDAGNA